MQPPQPINNIPLLGQREQQAKAQIQAVIGQLAMQIYSQTAVLHVNTRDVHQTLDAEALRTAAKNSIQAAQCYFEGIGAIEAMKGKPDG
ncbi:MAG: hypothetical protein U9Q82_03390 [Chloroflexota bacterium]|nr:hypothetical protein [Chloroflexota bacterium]